MNKDIITATDDDCDYLTARLEEHTQAATSLSNKVYEYFTPCIKENGEVVACIWGEVHFKTVLYIDILWVKEGHRNKGYGAILMKDVEEKAIATGCTLSVVDTYSFQAPGFYEKLGYTVFGTIDDCPVKGHGDFYMSKVLNSAEYANKNSPTEFELIEASEEDTAVMDYGIIDFNKSQIPFTQSPNTVWFDMCIKEGDEMVAGISSKSSCWKIFYLVDLWVKEEYRNKGYATALIRDVEKQAKDFGCEIAILETFNPAMRKLSEKLGYIVYGELENYPQGHMRYYMTKKL
ncbi:MAG: GNAT family N-acetyltransferase [Defluviitaleaceae bacterium]|nr:GNAT family N-acetyltransferase [Defluviitaleaceae bacterium]